MLIHYLTLNRQSGIFPEVKVKDVIRVLFVCKANTCRSVMAEAVCRYLTCLPNLNKRIEIDSVGTDVGRGGDLPNSRAIMVTREYGLDIGGLRSRSVTKSDFFKFDYILAMDKKTLSS